MTRDRKFHPNPGFAEPNWLTAEEYQAMVDEAKEWSIAAHADREYYDNESYWFQGPSMARDYSAERG